MVPEIIIQLVLYHDAVYLPGLIDSLRLQSYQHFQVIALDNSDDEAAAETFRRLYPEGELYRSEQNLGYAGGHSRLVEKTLQSGAAFVVVMNTDVQLHPDFLHHLRQHMIHFPQVGACGPVILEGKGTRKTNVIQNYRLYMNFRSAEKISADAGMLLEPENELPTFARVDYLSGVAFMIRTDLLRVMSFFDSQLFLYGEERDFFYRFRQKGYVADVVRDAVCWHFHDWSAQSRSGYQREYYYLRRNKVLYFKKYGLLKSLTAYLLKEVAMAPFTFFWSLRKGGAKMFATYWLGIWHGLMGRNGKGTL
ncbi:glycosyltransferase [Thermophagus sp. OGC60D27]|uniref:glycosyltransferase n=1 Tax=Thermophagus sp. OGC60D27 TaxID=3458415 RepID=UPI0040377EEE